MNDKEELLRAIATLESQRAILGDAVVNTSLAALHTRLAQLDKQEETPQKRKLATMLFMDMVAHTAMIHELDLEDQLAVIDQALSRLSEAVTAFGGQITRYQGDGFKAVFGLPSGDERDPDRAIQAGLAIQSRAGEIAKELEDEWGLLNFKVRVGIDTGMVIVGGLIEGQDSISGPAVNLAARLEKTAEPGAVVISHHTYQHVRGVFDLQSLDPLLVKGFSEPIPIYKVLRSKPRSFRTRRRGVEGVDTRMIGRSAEFTFVQALFQKMLEEGTQQWVTISGEAGLGKSRLLFEFEQWVDLQPHLITLYRARARQETQHVSYGLLRNLFAFRFNIHDDDPAEVMRAKMVDGFEEWMEPSAETRLKAQIVGRLLGYDFSNETIRALEKDPKQLRNRAQAAMVEYFRAVSSSPVIALFEDLHWADESSLDILTQLSIRQTERPVLIVAATRPILLERRPGFMHGQSHHHWLKLKPLTLADSRRLVAEVLKKVSSLPEHFQEMVAANAGGNPFFVEELIKMLVADGVIVKRETDWRVILEKISTVTILTTVAGVLQARLDGLPQIEREIMQRASITGHIFWDQQIASMNHPANKTLAAEDITDGLAGLRGKEMIYRLESSEFSGVHEYTFRHALLRDVTYNGILKQNRRTYHALAAAWLIGHSKAQAWKHTGLIADQLELGGEIRKAIVYLRRAGEEAAARYANSEAINYFSRALALCEKADLRPQFDLRISRLKILHRLGQRDQQEDELIATERIARSLDDNESLAEVKWYWAIYHANIGNLDAALSEGQECADLAEATGNQALQAKGHLARGRVLWRIGRLPEAQAQLEKALALARAVGERGLEANALLNLGNVIGDLGDLPSSRAYYEQSLAIDREMGSQSSAGIALNNLGIVSALSGNLADAQDYFQQSLDIARLTGNSAGEGLALGNLGNVTADRGDFAASYQFFEQYLANARSVKNRPGEGFALHGIGHALYGLQKFEEAAAYYEQALRLRDELGQEHFAIESRAGWAQAVLALGQTSEALSLVAPILPLLDARGTLERIETAATYWTCIQILTANEDPRAERLLEKAYRRVQDQAGKINDPVERQSFLENVEANREIIKLWRSLHSL